MRSSLLASLLLLTTACGGAGAYGYAREYEPLDDEEDIGETASPIGYEELRRQPDDFRATVVGWFGVVTAVEPLDGGSRARVTASFRRHQERHLCADETASSCRVTVSDRDGGPFTVELDLRDVEREGRERLWVGSLIKVYGTSTGTLSPDGAPMLAVRFHRHWPSGRYVTTGAAAAMRR